ncbi:chromate transporter [Carnobacteriaceae bacterium 52-44]|jgi:chromate transporter
MIYLQLFWSFLQVGAFSFGGGYAALPLIESIVVDQNGWLSIAEFTDLITISQMTPGPIAINSATFVGLSIGGFGGAIAATLGNIAPSIILVTLIAWLYMKYNTLDTLQNVLKALRPAVIAMIATAGVSLVITAIWGEGAILFSNMNIVAVVLFGFSLFLLLKYKLSPILVMVLAGVLNVVWALVSGAV